VHPDCILLLELAARLGPCLTGVMTHAGHSYACRSVREIEAVAEIERASVTRAAARLREAGYAIDIVSAGSSPTARHAENFAGVTEIRAGVYMFGDLFQAEIETHGADAIAVTVLTSVIGRRPGRILVDAGGLALSKDRSTEATAHDYGFGLALDIDGTRGFGNAIVRKAYQEHGVIELDPAHPVDLPIGAKLRIAPNHTCMTAAAHDRYFVVDGEQDVVAIWHRANGW
jgi:D-serine deaminase-like pyridoxal phosphate-dependent protein